MSQFVKVRVEASYCASAAAEQELHHLQVSLSTHSTVSRSVADSPRRETRIVGARHISLCAHLFRRRSISSSSVSTICQEEGEERESESERERESERESAREREREREREKEKKYHMRV